MYVNARAIIERETAAGTEIVLQIRNKPQYDELALELPGGRLEEFESFLDALQREVFEETGLTVTHIEGAESTVVAANATKAVECVRPFAIYQTTQGPFDSLGAYFRCRATGELVEEGDDTLKPRWVSVQQVAQQMAEDPTQFSWIDCAGIQFYLRSLGLFG